MRDRRSRPRDTDGGDDGGTIWLTIYSDMMTNLMLFFLMLFAMSRLQTGLREDLQSALKDQFSGKKVEQKFETTKEDRQIEDLKKIALVEETESRIKITLPAPVLFDIGKADVKAETGQILSDISQPLKDSKYPITVEGHTDNIPMSGGKYKSNWHLSAARAFAVLNYLTEREGINPARMSALGYGEYQPVASNDTEEDRAKNRRIDIILVKK
jgi:chemotaxis protein MotB